MRRLACFLALLAIALPTSAASTGLLQPPASQRGLQMETAEGRAWLLEPNGQRRRMPLHRGELIEELVEFEKGWAAGGTRRIGSRRELVVVVDSAAGVERLRPVPEPLGQLRVRPVPLASAERFEGLAWLEGDSPTDYVVRVAEWSGASWEPPVTVSKARRRGQAGLVGTVLEDGRWLLVWSASDGRGSELLWAVRENGRWTPPRRVAAPSRNPDVTPSLVRVPGGALLAWARRQGTGYKLQTTRLGTGWSPPRRLGGVSAWAPRFVDLADEGRFLLHRSPEGWTALELDAGGVELRRAEQTDQRRERPVLSAGGGGIALRWERREAPRPLRWEGSP